MIERGEACCFTGHRPGKLAYGADETHPDCLRLKAAMAGQLCRLAEAGVREFIAGMALGTDLWFAESVLALRARRPQVRLVAAIPHPGQERRWSAVSPARYQGIVVRADEVHVLCPFYVQGCMQMRNRYMVDRAGHLLAVYEGGAGGTKYTIDYARRNGLTVTLLRANGETWDHFGVRPVPDRV